MVAVVIGVAGATLLVTQRRVQATYDDIFKARFKREMDYFEERQELRLNDVKEKCRRIAENVRIRAAMEASSDEEQVALLYEVAGDQLQGVQRSELRRAPPARGPRKAQRVESPLVKQTPFAFFRFVSAGGQVLSATNKEAGLLARRAEARIEDQLSFVSRGMGAMRSQQVGYLALKAAGREVLQELIVTPIFGPEKAEPLGALVLSFPLPDMGGKDLNAMSQVLSCIVFEGTVYRAENIPTTVQTNLLADVAGSLKKAGEELGDDLSVSIASVPYRVFYEALNPDSPFPPAYHVGLYSLADALSRQRQLRLWILGVAGVALVVASGVGFFLAHTLTAPIAELVRGTVEVQRGNFTARVPVRSGDELGQLAGSFNEMTEGLSQKERYRTIINQIADKAVAEELIKGRLGGEAREVSILFCDIRGFTALTENMPPQEVIEMLNEHMTTLTRVVYENHGVVDKFVGDLIMAIFGAPTSLENDAYNAARCALRIILERNALNETSRHRIEVGIGIATGQVVAGCMGSADRLNYTVLGERVNLASRLCSKAGRGEIVIDNNTQARLGSLITVEARAAMELKGFSEPVATFKLVEVHSLAADSGAAPVS